MAVIRTAREDAACLKGLYAIYSMVIPSIVQRDMARRIP